jgi:SAM-dependent methyltransferase
MSYLKLDLGCGSCKKEGTIGVDIFEQPGVDYVLNLEKDRLPFEDRSVQYIYSSHCLEHLANPTGLFAEMSRVCVDGAKIEIWTPYAWENSAFIIDHKSYFNEDHYLHMCVWYADFWYTILNSRWLLTEFTYVINPNILIELHQNGISLDFALKYYKGIVKEFCAYIEVRKGYEGEVTQPIRTFATDRYAQRHLIPSKPSKDFSEDDINQAIEWLITSS